MPESLILRGNPFLGLLLRSWIQASKQSFTKLSGESPTVEDKLISHCRYIVEVNFVFQYVFYLALCINLSGHTLMSRFVAVELKCSD